MLCGRKQYGIEGNGHAIEHYEHSKTTETDKNTDDASSKSNTDGASSNKQNVQYVHSVFAKVRV